MSGDAGWFSRRLTLGLARELGHQRQGSVKKGVHWRGRMPTSKDSRQDADVQEQGRVEDCMEEVAF